MYHTIDANTESGETKLPDEHQYQLIHLHAYVPDACRIAFRATGLAKHGAMEQTANAR